MVSRFPMWAKGTGAFYSVGSISKEDNMTKDPLAFIKIMNVIFPSNSIGSKATVSPRGRLDRARDPDSSDIITIKDFYAYPIISGVDQEPEIGAYYPVPKDEAELKKYRRKLKGIKHVAVVKYAEAISEYLAEFVRRDLLPFWQGGDLMSGRDKKPKKEAISSFGLVKFSEKRNANMYYGGIINDEGLLALWNLINK
jgi:hypothetical protein